MAVFKSVSLEIPISGLQGTITEPSAPFDASIGFDRPFIISFQNTVQPGAITYSEFSPALLETLFVYRTSGSSQVYSYDIQTIVNSYSQNFSYDLIEGARLFLPLVFRPRLSEDLAPVVYRYGTSVVLTSYGADGGYQTRDVTGKIARVSIKYGMDSYCAECDVEWLDIEMFRELDLSNENNFGKERLEVFTAVNGEPSVSQGRFLIEKRSTGSDGTSMSLSTWGRSKQCLLGEPYASTMNMAWGLKEDGSNWKASEIAKGIAEAGGVDLTWGVHDYKILPNKLTSTTDYPIDIIGRLAGTVCGLVVPTKSGGLNVIYHYDMPGA